MSLTVLAMGAVLVCPGAECGLTALDTAGLALANALRSEMLDRLMAGVTWLGSLAVLLPWAVLVAWRRLQAGHRLEAVFIPLALIGASVLAHLSKLWVARPRPELYYLTTAMPADWSYPSAHTMQAMAAGLACFLVLRRRQTGWPGQWTLAALIGGLVMLVGLSRIYLQVHFPSDVLAGGLAAAFWVFGLHALLFRQAAKSVDHEVITDKAGDRT